MPVELKPMTHRLNEMLERLERDFRQRKQFLADAAHELRTPTAALLTTLEVTLRRPREPAELTAAMQSGLADARRLRKLVEQLMEHARSEHVRGPESMQPTDVPAMLKECVEIVTPLAKEKEVVITEELPPQPPFVTQRERVRSVVLNLLSNAIEYNKRGGAIRIAAERSDGTLRISVADTGVGIAQDQLAQVFEPFYRGGNGRGDDPDHLGLGLFLVRSHVDALHGKCEIDSTLGEGTTLRITLPEPPEQARMTKPE
jgi:signal transduction histidine kinase